MARGFGPIMTLSPGRDSRCGAWSFVSGVGVVADFCLESRDAPPLCLVRTFCGEENGDLSGQGPQRRVTGGEQRSEMGFPESSSVKRQLNDEAEGSKLSHHQQCESSKPLTESSESTHTHKAPSDCTLIDTGLAVLVRTQRLSRGVFTNRESFPSSLSRPLRFMFTAFCTGMLRARFAGAQQPRTSLFSDGGEPL